MNLQNEISTQKQHGVYYTPRPVVDDILARVTGGSLAGKTLCDPSCGTGNFLIAAAEKIIAETDSNQNASAALQKGIYGFDSDAESLRLCRDRLNGVLRANGIRKKIQWNLHCFDSSDKKNIESFAGGFDFVVGNPPYIRIQHLSADVRKNIAWQWRSAAHGCSDIYMAFFDIGIFLLGARGRLGYITPNGYTKTEAGMPLREFLYRSNLVRELVDFGGHQVFTDATTYSLITVLDKTPSNRGARLSRYEGGNIRSCGVIGKERLRAPQWDLCGRKDYERILKIRTRGVPLHEIADIHVGVQTLADDVFILERIGNDGDFLICKTADGETVLLEKESVLPILKVSVMKNGRDPKNRVLICPYRRDSLEKLALIPEDELRICFPETFSYLQKCKVRLLQRDKGAFKGRWYAYGREMNLQKTLGKKILTSGINRAPNFMKCPCPKYTFYSGYSIKIKNRAIGEDELLMQLNSDDMDFFIRHTGRDYRNNWKSYSKAFIKHFGVVSTASLLPLPA